MKTSENNLEWPCETCGHARRQHFKFDEECCHVLRRADDPDNLWSRQCSCVRYVPRPAADEDAYSERLREAIEAGMVGINRGRREATVYAPPVEPETLTDDDWLLLLRAATEMKDELRALGYMVKG